MWMKQLSDLIRSIPLRMKSTEPSLFEELWAYFEGKFFSVDTGRYEHIQMGTGSLIKGWRAKAWLCESCQTVIIPLNSDNE